MRITHTVRESILRELADGDTHDEVARRHGVGRGTVYRVSRAAKPTRIHTPGRWQVLVQWGSGKLSLGEVLAETYEAALALAKERAKGVAIWIGPSQGGPDLSARDRIVKTGGMRESIRASRRARFGRD